MRLSRAAAEHYREVADRYKVATGEAVIEISEAVAWAIGGGQLELSPADLTAIHTNRMSEALRSDQTTDTLGRRVRLRHCVVTAGHDAAGRLVQKHLWAHIDDASDDHLLVALHQRRTQIQGDVEALRADLDFINERRQRLGKSPIQMSFDFTTAEVSHDAG